MKFNKKKKYSEKKNLKIVLFQILEKPLFINKKKKKNLKFFFFNIKFKKSKKKIFFNIKKI
jgi:hypothetical protein